MAAFNAVFIILLSIGVCAALKLHLNNTLEEFPNCKATEAARNIADFCYLQTRSKKYDKNVVEDVPQKDIDDITFCNYRRSGAVTADGTAFNVDRATTFIATVVATDAVKAALTDGVKTCGANGGDGHTFIACTTAMAEKICKT